LGQMQDLIMMFLQSLNLHTGNAVIQPLELPVPRHSRCTHWISRKRHRARDAVVVVEELLPEEVIPRHRKPLTTGEPSAQYCLMREMQEDFQHQAVRQARATSLCFNLLNLLSLLVFYFFLRFWSVNCTLLWMFVICQFFF
uniref:Uncharacterized protein n=1 Tax=Sinocyclocheilus rhinocerous TaxID=307959 RepID=A0A673KL28_9TELE